MFALASRLLRRFGFGGQASRPASRPQVRLSLEALDERIVPTFPSLGGSALGYNSLGLNYATFQQVAPLISPLTTFDPAPVLAATGTNAFTSTIDLGLGTLHVQSATVNSAVGGWNFAGTFESSNQIPINGFNVSDDIGALSFISGQINRWPTLTGTGVFNGSTLSYYTTGISFQASGSGTITLGTGFTQVQVPEAQTVTFTGSVLSVWFNGQAVPVGVSGTIDIKDHVTDIPVGNPTADFDTTAVVPGTMWLGTPWASIVH